MDTDAFLTLRAAGVLLILSVVVPFLALVVITRGDFSGYQASIRGIEGVGESAEVLRTTFPLASLTVVLTLAGYGLFSVLLHEAGDAGISTFAFILLLFSQVFLIFQGSFHSSVTVWAAKNLSATGSVPALFDPLWQWMYTSVQQVYVSMGLLAIAAYGWAILQAGILPGWLGWGSMGWAGVWLILFFAAGDNLPLVLFLPPVVIGAAATFG